MIFNLLKRALGEDACELGACDKEMWKSIYQIAKKHDLSHMVGHALKSTNVTLEDEIKKAFDKDVNVAVFRYMKSNYELENVSKALSKAQIPYMPLKGSVLRKYYNEPWLRTSCDIDVLVKREDVERAKEVIAKELGYECLIATTLHDVSMMSPSGIHFELHFELKEELFKESAHLSSIWSDENIVKISEYEYGMTNEMFLFYHIYHMAKHFKLGGCGIKPLLDLWIIKNKMGYNEEKALELLTSEGLDKFYKNAVELSNAWFEGAEHTNVTKNMEAFILEGGVYGSLEQGLAVSQGEKGGGVKYLWRRVFLPYSRLIIAYPSLKKCPPLYPFYQVHRWFRVAFGGGRKRAINELKTSQAVSQEQIDAARILNEQLGL